jgi:chromosome segregation ATPase
VKGSVSSSCSKMEFARGKRDNEDKDDDNAGETEFLWRRRREQDVLLRDEEVNEDVDNELKQLREENEKLRKAILEQETEITESHEEIFMKDRDIRKRRENANRQKVFWEEEARKNAKLRKEYESQKTELQYLNEENEILKKENSAQEIEIAGLQEEIFMKDLDIGKRREYAMRLKESLEKEKGKCARLRIENGERKTVIERMDADIIRKESDIAMGENRLQKTVVNAVDVSVNRFLETFVKNMDEQNWIQRLTLVPIFDGATREDIDKAAEDWEDWINQFETHFGQYSDELKCKALKQRLTGEAKDAWKRLPEEQQFPYAVLIGNLTKSLVNQSPAAGMAKRIKFNMMMQVSGQNVRQYI